MIFRRYDANTAEIVRLFLMTPDGKVGFNNNNPQYRVDVGGNMRVGTDLVVNNNLNVANDVNIAGDVFTTGETKTAVLEITGGSDLSEKFNILPAATQDKVEPGMVVAIDPARPGALKVASSPYDTKVAGIVSGAGGVRTGMLLGQADHALVNGEFPVALSGRVYCFADATHGAIQPGDLLTSSATPGHAMKAADSARAQGAILGKAMTGLDKGKGLVLVLVNLH